MREKPSPVAISRLQQGPDRYLDLAGMLLATKLTS